MKILVTGAKGMLAHDLVPILREGHEVIPCSRQDLDITVRDSVSGTLRRITPEIVINCAAYAQVDKAEEEKGTALLVNGIGVQNLALVCDEMGIPLCHISSDYVFNGEKRSPYTPFDATDPINGYGESKLAGEKYIQWLTRKFYIVRTSWLYGRGGNNFVSTILRLAGEKPELRVVHDQIGSPTSTVSLSHAIKGMIQTGAYGIYHVTDETGGGISWHDFAQEIVKRSGLSTPVVPVPTEEFPRPAKRPRYSVLDMSLFSLATGRKPPHWQDALKAYLTAS